MKYLKIQNDGLLDIRLLSLMGGTTKAHDEFKIGQWGSGLKYSMAWMLRSGLDLKIFIGTEEVRLSTIREEIRGEVFEIICVNGVKTSVTTNMGGQAWKPWMIVREIWCNALDEGGANKEVTELTEGESGKTTFYLQFSHDFQDVYRNWQQYFIHDLTPLHEDGKYKIYPGNGHFCLYKQGVLIHKSEKTPSVFCYDIQDADINELREFNGSRSMPAVYALAKAPVSVCRLFFATINKDCFEATMDWFWGDTFSTNWIEALDGKKLIHDNLMALMLTGWSAGDLDNTVMVPSKVYEKFVKMFPDIGCTKITKSGEFIPMDNPILMNKVREVVTMLERCDYHISPSIEIITGRFEKKDIIAQADVSNRSIMLSEQLAEKTTHYIASTIIEENEHIKTGMSDKTRAFQQHFIDLYTRELMARKGFEGPIVRDQKQEEVFEF